MKKCTNYYLILIVSFYNKLTYSKNYIRKVLKNISKGVDSLSSIKK